MEKLLHLLVLDFSPYTKVFFGQVLCIWLLIFIEFFFKNDLEIFFFIFF